MELRYIKQGELSWSGGKSLGWTGVPALAICELFQLVEGKSEGGGKLVVTSRKQI